jgi:hypothetical protein
MGVNSMKFLLHAVFVILLILVTYFGLGPVLLADGGILERILTAAVVVVIYIVLIFLYRKSFKWFNRG